MESQVHCSGSVISSWKERFFVLNLMASDFRMLLAPYSSLGPAYLPGSWAQGQKDARGNYSSGTQRETKGRAKALKMLLTHIFQCKL